MVVGVQKAARAQQHWYGQPRIRRKKDYRKLREVAKNKQNDGYKSIYMRFYKLSTH